MLSELVMQKVMGTPALMFQQIVGVLRLHVGLL
jgi:hypothetical protein